MKKRLLLIGGILVTIIVVVLLVVNLGGVKYTIRVSLIDDKSPDRLLTVYKGNQKIDVKKIEYLDGTLLCNGYNTTVYFGDIDKEEKLKVILNDNSEIIAKIVEEEVKK